MVMQLHLLTVFCSWAFLITLFVVIYVLCSIAVSCTYEGLSLGTEKQIQQRLPPTEVDGKTYRTDPSPARSAVPRSYNIHLWRFTWHLLALLLPQHSPFLTASAASLRGLPTGWTDNKPVKAALWGGINPELGLRWMMCSRGLLIQGEGGWHKKPCEVWTPERLPAVMSCCYFKRGTAAVTWLDLSGDISNGGHPFYPPFHPFFTTLLNPHRSR